MLMHEGLGLQGKPLRTLSWIAGVSPALSAKREHLPATKIKWIS